MTHEVQAETGSPDEKFFTLWTVFRRGSASERGEHAVQAFDALVAELAAQDVTLRGAYDVSAMRADADVLVWLHGPQPEALQEAVRRVRRSELFAGTEVAFSAMGVHVNAEFSRSHSPAFSRGVEPEPWLCFYPFVRSYEWYILPEEERGRMLREHGMLGREFPQVQANTVASFALGDWEWLLALEAPELIDLVDMMRRLRYSDARNHVREEVPFYTGRRIATAEIAEVLS